MTSDELWNINTLELPSTITAANEPSSSTTTILNTEIEGLEATREFKTAGLISFQTSHEELEKESKETQALLDKGEVKLTKLASNTRTLLEAMCREKVTLAQLKERINTLFKTVTPLHDTIKKLETQLDKKVTEANEAKQLEDTTALSSKLQREYHRTSGKGFITAMKKWYNYSNWKSTKSTKDNRNI
jgi:chromosome segregation ATPase